jgi:hypothetical protein
MLRKATNSSMILRSCRSHHCRAACVAGFVCAEANAGASITSNATAYRFIEVRLKRSILGDSLRVNRGLNTLGISTASTISLSRRHSYARIHRKSRSFQSQFYAAGSCCLTRYVVTASQLRSLRIALRPKWEIGAIGLPKSGPFRKCPVQSR